MINKKQSKKKCAKSLNTTACKSPLRPIKKVVDFLDITLHLRTDIFKPYKKPNSNLTYIHKQSNHPPSIIKHLPKIINKRLSTNSKNAQKFKNRTHFETRCNTQDMELHNSCKSKKSLTNMTTDVMRIYFVSKCQNV